MQEAKNWQELCGTTPKVCSAKPQSQPQRPRKTKQNAEVNQVKESTENWLNHQAKTVKIDLETEYQNQQP